MLIRSFRLGDEVELHRVFHSSVHGLAAQDYLPEQLEAWAPDHPDMERWTHKMRSLQPFVADDSGHLVGYADLQSDGLIDHFYVAGGHARRGIGRLLMRTILARAGELRLPRLWSDVSLTARVFFEHFGFTLVQHRLVIIAGVELANVRMEKSLLPTPPGLEVEHAG